MLAWIHASTGLEVKRLAISSARLAWMQVMPIFKWKPSHKIFAMSIEPSLPKACFLAFNHPAAMELQICGWCVTGYNRDNQSCSAGVERGWMRQAPNSLRKICQLTRGFWKPTLPTPYLSPQSPTQPSSWIGWWLGCLRGYLGWCRLAWSWAIPASKGNLAIRCLQPLISLLLWTFNHPSNHRVLTHFLSFCRVWAWVSILHK